MAFTVEKLLKLPLFREAAVLAGSVNLSAPVTGVAMPESGDFDSAAIRGCIVLSSAFLLEQFSRGNFDYVSECGRRGAAGLCIKTSAAYVSLPKNIILAAEQMGFPLIVLNSNVDFCQLITTINYELLHRDGYNDSLSFEENFFQELISSPRDRETFSKRGAMIGLGRDERLCALLVTSDNGKIAEDVCEFCRSKWEQQCYSLTRNERVLIALRLTISEVDKTVITALAEDLLQRLKSEFAPSSFRMGIGRCYKELGSFNKSFSDACSALSFSMLSHSKNPISHFDNLGVYRILFDYKNREELFRLYRDTVGLISEYDLKNHTVYLDTIRTYFAQNYSVNNTAKKMFVHYNTILYRMNKINLLFGIDLNNEEDRINCYVSLRAADAQNLWKSQVPK